MKKKFCLFMVIVMLLSFSPSAFASSYEKTEEPFFILENGSKVSELEFIKILYSYEGPIYKISDETNILDDDYVSDDTEHKYQLMSAISIPMNDVMKIMAGSWYIPGIGKIVVAAGGIYIGGMALIKAGSWLSNIVKSWLRNRAISKQIDRAVSELGGVNSNTANHILQYKHNWNSLVPGPQKDPNRWNRIKEIIKKVMKNGYESKYGKSAGVYKKRLTYNGKIVEVTYRRLKGGIIKISNAWVKK